MYEWKPFFFKFAMNKNLFQSLSLSLNSLVTSFDINTQHQASFLARVSKSFKSTFLLSRFPVQLWTPLSRFPKIALYNPFFNYSNFLTFLSDFFRLYRHIFLSDFDHFCHAFPKFLYLSYFFNFSTFWHFFWLLSTIFLFLYK